VNAIDILDAAAARDPDAPALVWAHAGRARSLSFGALVERSRRIAALLRARGLRPGDGVVVLLPMAGPLYEVMAAILRLGATAVFPDPAHWRESLERTAATMPLRGFVGTPMACLARWLVPTLRRVPLAFVAGVPLPGAVPLRAADGLRPLAAPEDCAPGATALLSFTSGSTGRPKGVLRTHAMLEATQRILSREMELAPRQVQLAVLPFFVFAYLGAGATSVIPPLDLRSPAAADPAVIARWIEAWKVTGLGASPFLLRRLAEPCAREPQRLASLRSVFAGGAPVTPAVLDAIHAVAPAARVAALYGATEAEPIALAARDAYGTPERAAVAGGRGLLAGRPVAEISLRILGPRGELLPQGGEGEIAVAGPNVSPGYLGGEGDREHKLAAGGVLWHRTGDAGYVDARGRLWLVGRCAGGLPGRDGMLYPLRVEAALSGEPGVARATVAEHGGRRVLVVQPAAAPGTLDPEHLAARVAWCGADEVVLMRRIPTDRRHLAKIDVPALREALARGRWLERIPL
jgi:acyl-CoA synthetase (AMP-forming)/AMP-acid ligase II